MVEGQGGKSPGHGRVAVDDDDLVRLERPRHQRLEERAEPRRVLRHLEHRAVAGGESTGQRRYREIQRVVPRHDDADDAERLAQQARAARQAPPGDGAAFRAHPAAQVAPRVRDAVEAGELLEQLGFLRGAHAEVGGNRVADPGCILAQHARESRESLAPFGCGGMGVHRERAALQLQSLRELRRMGREAGRFLCRGHRG